MEPAESGFAQVVNSLILKVKDISICFLSWMSMPSQFGVCNSQKSQNWHKELLGSDREKRNLKMQFEWGPCQLSNVFVTLSNVFVRDLSEDPTSGALH